MAPFLRWFLTIFCRQGDSKARRATSKADDAAIKAAGQVVETRNLCRFYAEGVGLERGVFGSARNYRPLQHPSGDAFGPIGARAAKPRRLRAGKGATRSIHRGEKQPDSAL